MKIIVNGRICKIQEFANYIKNCSSYKHCNIEFMPSEQFNACVCENVDVQSCALLQIGSNWFDFKLLQDKRFRTLEIKITSETYIIIKHKGSTGYQYVPVTKKSVIPTKVVQAFSNDAASVNLDALNLEADQAQELTEYEDLEKYEERIINEY